MDQKLNGISKLLIISVLFFILVSCANNLPKILKEEHENKLYFPVIYSVENKFGVAGCPSSCVTIGCSWCYDWNTNPKLIKNTETIPMIWDERFINEKIGGNSKYLLGFNECDLSRQCNLLPQEAVEPWNIVEQNNPDKLLVAPVPSHLNPNWIIEFREEFYKKYNRYPRFSVLAFHCYEPWAIDCINLGNKFIDLANKWNIKEVWCTEFAFLEAYNKDYKNQINIFISWLESTNIITRYAPYVSNRGECPTFYWTDCRSIADPSLFEKDLKTLTELGKIYAKY